MVPKGRYLGVRCLHEVDQLNIARRVDDVQWYWFANNSANAKDTEVFKCHNFSSAWHAVLFSPLDEVDQHAHDALPAPSEVGYTKARFSEKCRELVSSFIDMKDDFSVYLEPLVGMVEHASEISDLEQMQRLLEHTQTAISHDELDPRMLENWSPQTSKNQ